MPGDGIKDRHQENLGLLEELTTDQEAQGGKPLPVACSETSCVGMLLIQKLDTGNSPINSIVFVLCSNNSGDVEKGYCTSMSRP